jgi:hypothetical protein
MNAVVAPVRRQEPLHRRTLQPVRRESRRAGGEFGTIWRPQTNDRWLILRAARLYNRRHRKRGDLDGPLGRLGLDLLEELLNRVNRKTGRLDPSYQQIAAWMKRSEKGVWRALAKLRAHGFLDWVRRYVEADEGGDGSTRRGRGSPVRQTSNAYWMSLPRKAAILLGRLAQKPPPPEDDEARRRRMVDELRAYEKDDASPGVRRADAKAAALISAADCDFP